MGAPFVEVWADAWEQAKPIIDEAFAGRANHFVDLPWTLDTDRGQRDTWWSFSYSRVLDADGEIAGLLIFTNETTDRVLADEAAREGAEALRELNRTLEAKVEERSAALRLYENIVQSDAAPVVAFDHELKVTAFNKAHGEYFMRVYGQEAKVGDVLPDLFRP